MMAEKKRKKGATGAYSIVPLVAGPTPISSNPTMNVYHRYDDDDDEQISCGGGT